MPYDPPKSGWPRSKRRADLVERTRQLKADNDRLWVALEGIRQLREKQRHTARPYEYFEAIDGILARALNKADTFPPPYDDWNSPEDADYGKKKG